MSKRLKLTPEQRQMQTQMQSEVNRIRLVIRRSPMVLAMIEEEQSAAHAAAKGDSIDAELSALWEVAHTLRILAGMELEEVPKR